MHVDILYPSQFGLIETLNWKEVTFFRKWLNKNIIFINDLLDEKGLFVLDILHLERKFNVITNFMTERKRDYTHVFCCIEIREYFPPDLPIGLTTSDNPLSFSFH